MAMAIGSKVQRVIIGVITAVVLILVGVALGPTVIDSVTDINSTTLDGVPLESVISLLATYIPTFYYLAVVLGAMVAIWAAVKFG